MEPEGGPQLVAETAAFQLAPFQPASEAAFQFQLVSEAVFQLVSEAAFQPMPAGL
jgi:hypothetical protein